MIVEPNDPLFKYQWFLKNTGQSGGGVGSDINVLPVWPDYTGKGVRVAIVDDGVQLDHPDLTIDTALSWDAVNKVQGGGPVAPSQNHGTAVAGLVGELANNGIGGSGVAPDATLIAYRIALDDTYAAAAPIFAFEKALEANAAVVNNSWGTSAAFANNVLDPENADFFTALNDLAVKGRDQLGTIVLVANGNDGRTGYDGDLNNFQNSRYVIAVGAVDDTGVLTAYSTQGANLLVSAPGGASTSQADTQPGTGTLTTDRTSVDGYNILQGAAGDYAYNFNGTSAATPIVSGVVALMLDANPGLGYRDVQEVLAHSARFVDPAALSWTTTNVKTWNGGGAKFSRDYGFGEVDAHAAVRLAEAYRYLHPNPQDDRNVEVKSYDVVFTDPVVIRGNTDPNLPISSVTFTIAASDNLDLNHVDLKLDASIGNPSEFIVQLTSPSGTTISMISTPQNALQITTVGGLDIRTTEWPATGFLMGTNAFWGEQSQDSTKEQGDLWQVTVSVVNFGAGGTLLGAALNIYGDAPSTEKEFVYTDSFATLIAADKWQAGAPSRATIKVADHETAVIDAAAMSSDVVVNLVTHQAEIQGQPITIDPAARVTKIFTGDGNDRLVADAADNLLLAGRGHNDLDGGGGIDTALYIGSRAGYSATYSTSGVFTAEALSHGSSDVAAHIEKAAFAEGTLYVQAAGDTSLGIAALYNGLLFRATDAAGYRYWTNEAAAGTGLSTIADSFLASSEYANGAGKLDNATFLQDVYQGLLHRPIDAGGAAYWNAELTSGAQTRAAVVISIEHSVEYQTTQLTGVFSDIASLGNLWG